MQNGLVQPVVFQLCVEVRTNGIPKNDYDVCFGGIAHQPYVACGSNPENRHLR